MLRRRACETLRHRGKMAEKTDTRRGGHLPLEVPYASKVHLPARRPAIVRRERLIEQLSRSLEQRVTLISAPAGYGKTTLLLDFAQSWKDSVCWYSLDERDTDLPLFLRYFLAAGRGRFADFGAGLDAALRAPAAITGEQATDLMVEAVAGAGGPSVFILDDFHYLDSAPDDLRTAIEGWLCRLPPNRR